MMNKNDELSIGRDLVEREGESAALGIAAANSFLFVMRWLLDERSVDIDSRSPPNHETALHKAANLGLRGSVKLLLQRGADTDLVNGVGLTPLMMACSAGGTKAADVALIMIEAGADVHVVREYDHQNALTFALRSAQPRVVEALRAAGAVDCTPAPEKLEAERAERRYPRLIKNGRAAFKAGDYGICRQVLSEARAIRPLDKLSEKYLALASERC